jgi:hypothetical protein
MSEKSERSVQLTIPALRMRKSILPNRCRRVGEDFPESGFVGDVARISDGG